MTSQINMVIAGRPATILYRYEPGDPGDFYSPPEPEHVEVLHIYVGGADIMGRYSEEELRQLERELLGGG